MITLGRSGDLGRTGLALSEKDVNSGSKTKLVDVNLNPFICILGIRKLHEIVT
jgi:hypothetical protein